MRHIVLTGLLGSSLLLSLASCDPEPTATSDAEVEHDSGPPVDASLPDDPDAAAETCDCCGTTLFSNADAGGCGGGLCDPWCGHVDPCGESCDRATHVCVSTFAGVDGGTGGVECVPRPSACDALENCGGPAPDPTCDVSDPCFDALECAPHRVIHRGYLVQCRGA